MSFDYNREGFFMSESRYQLLSVDQAAKQLGRARWFVYKLIDSRRLPYHLIGGRRCISQRDLDEYVTRSRVVGVGEKKTKITVQEMTSA